MENILVYPRTALYPDTADKIFHLLGNARAYLRKDNSYKNCSKGIFFYIFARPIACCYKNRDFEVKNT